jgi:hypothetical protein
MTDQPATRRYFACKFRAEDSRSYTYHFDGPPFEKGNVVRVEDRDGDGWKKVIVVGVTDQKPAFATKPILCRHVEEDAPAYIPASQF